MRPSHRSSFPLRFPAEVVARFCALRRAALLLVMTIAATCSPQAADTADIADTAASSSTPLVAEGTIPLPGVSGRFDHFACDPSAPRIFVAALGNDSLEVLDPIGRTRIRSVDGLARPTGVLLLPQVAQVWVASSGDGSLRAFDSGTLAPAARVESLDDADNIRLDPASGLVWIGHAAALAAVDPAKGQRVASIALAGHPESFQLEPRSQRIFVNVPDAGEIAVVDRERREVVKHWPLGRFQANYPMVLDVEGHRVLAGCRKPARLLVLDADSGTVTGDFEMSGDADDMFLDTKRGRLYVSCGEGVIDVFRRTDADHYERTARVPTRDGARTCYWSEPLDRLFLAVPQRSGKDAEIRVFRPQ